VRALLAILLPALAVPASAAPGQPFRSEAGGYSVGFPAQPTETLKAKNDVNIHLASAVAPNGSASYVVGWGDYFAEVELAKEQLFDDEMGALARGGARIGSQKAVRVAGFGGRAFQGVMPDGKALHGRFLLRDARFYMLLVLTTGPGGSAVADAFVRSFALVGPGIPDPPKAPVARRVVFPEAGVSLEVHGTPDRSKLPGGARESPMVAARSRGGLRIEIATYDLSPARSGSDKDRLLDGVVKGFGKSFQVRETRALVAAGKPARQFRARLGTGDAVVRAVHLDQGVLVLQIIGRGGSVDGREAEAFFDSLRIESSGG
jgi:hypothetical protein